MKNIIAIFKSDLRSLSKNFFALVVAIGLCALPALYAWFNIFSNWNPYGNTGNIKIAVANLDAGDAEDGKYTNMGDDLVEELRQKDSIGWVFVDTQEEAVEGVSAGDYYAALVIDENFTYSMYHGISDTIENPKITYYVNGKKNAVATKITDTAVSTVQHSINEQYVEAVTERIFTETNELSEKLEERDAVEEFIGKLEGVSENLGTYDKMIDSFVEANESLITASNEANATVAAGREDILEGVERLEDGQKDLDATAASFTQFSKEVTNSLTQIETSITTIQTEIEAAKLEQDAQILAKDMEQINKDVNELSKELNALKGELPDSAGNAYVEALSKAIDQSVGALASISTDGEVASDFMKLTIKEMNKSLDEYASTVASVNTMYTKEIVPQVNQMLNAMNDTLEAAQKLLISLSDTALGAGEVFNNVGTTLDTLNMSLSDLQSVIQGTKGRIDQILFKLHEASAEEQLEMIVNLLEGDPKTLGAFFSEPVQVEEHYIYEIANYGSGVSPFYTTLAIWVGMTILVSLVKVHAPKGELKDVKPHELFFGRYLLFCALSQIQTLIIVLGDLYLLKIQCVHPFMFVCAASVTSLTFSLLIYSLTIAFGDIGKAFAVVIMVIQIAGSGGTFPIEALPDFFRNVYIFFPFPYAIDAMRECIGGTYQNKYFICLIQLLLFCAAALVIGLVIRIPFIKLNHFIEKRMEDTKML